MATKIGRFKEKGVLTVADYLWKTIHRIEECVRMSPNDPAYMEEADRLANELMEQCRRSPGIHGYARADALAAVGLVKRHLKQNVAMRAFASSRQAADDVLAAAGGQDAEPKEKGRYFEMRVRALGWSDHHPGQSPQVYRRCCERYLNAMVLLRESGNIDYCLCNRCTENVNLLWGSTHPSTSGLRQRTAPPGSAADGPPPAGGLDHEWRRWRRRPGTLSGTLHPWRSASRGRLRICPGTGHLGT